MQRATLNRSGPNSAANPPQERPREGGNHQERAWLAGVSWLQSLTQDEREAAFAAIRLPAELEEQAAERAAMPHGEALRDIARSIRRWGDAHHFGAADQLDAIAQALAAETPPGLSSDLVRLLTQALCVTEQMLLTMLDAADSNAEGLDWTVQGAGARAYDLTCAVENVLSSIGLVDLDEQVAELRQVLPGTYRAALRAPGAAS